jgi:hypothetical protein
VLPASLTSTDEVLALAGVDHITVAPPLLQLLSLPDCGIPGSVFDNDASEIPPLLKPLYMKDEAAYRIAFTRDLAGASEEKLSQVCLSFQLRRERREGGK